MKKEVLNFVGGFFCCLLWMLFTYYFILIFG